jgi:hypothetical protein
MVGATSEVPVIHPREYGERNRLGDALAAYERSAGQLPGIIAPTRRRTLVDQLIESERRGRYIQYLVDATLSDKRVDPSSALFDPLKAAVIHSRKGDLDEALWMVFLFVHFGKHRQGGWHYAASVYGRCGSPLRWDWPHVRQDVPGFRHWMEANMEAIRGGQRSGFGNHRKYESLSGRSSSGTGAVVASYVEWICGPNGQSDRIDLAVRAASDEQAAFEQLFQSMSQIRRFGRTAKFDYLSTVGKLSLAPIRPGRAYLIGSTGPLKGARLLFESNGARPIGAGSLDERLVHLGEVLRVGFDVLEDALCNWQKSPDAFRPFRG